MYSLVSGVPGECETTVSDEHVRRTVKNACKAQRDKSRLRQRKRGHVVHAVAPRAHWPSSGGRVERTKMTKGLHTLNIGIVNCDSGMPL